MPWRAVLRDELLRLTAWASQYPSDDSDSDSPGFYTSAAPPLPQVPESTRLSSHSSQARRRRVHSPQAERRGAAADPTPAPSHELTLRKSSSLLEVLGQLWHKEGAWGVWKGTNVTFVYNFLLKTTETWTRSLLAALLNVPDPGLLSGGASSSGIGGLDIVESPNPITSLAVVVAAAALAAVVLAPLDLIRTRY